MKPCVLCTKPLTEHRDLQWVNSLGLVHAECIEGADAFALGDWDHYLGEQFLGTSSL